jgi:hypothetical protein
MALSYNCIGGELDGVLLAVTKFAPLIFIIINALPTKITKGGAITNPSSLQL